MRIFVKENNTLQPIKLFTKQNNTLKSVRAFSKSEIVVPFVPTPELVYTLSSDGTYYIVGTGANTIEQIQTWNEQDSYGTYTDGSGLNSSWQGGEVHIPAFYNGKPVKAVNPRAFGLVRNITKMIIQDGQMTTIGKGFMRCELAPNNDTTLTDVVFPTTLTSLGGVAFQNREGLVNCNLGDTNTQIYGGYWFNGCNALTSITIPSSVTSIGSYAFYYCKNLTSITIPSSVTSIESGVFYNCYALTDFNFDGTISQWNSVSKGADWKTNSPFTVVHCTDGDAPV